MKKSRGGKVQHKDEHRFEKINPWALTSFGNCSTICLSWLATMTCWKIITWCFQRVGCITVLRSRCSNSFWRRDSLKNKGKTYKKVFFQTQIELLWFLIWLDRTVVEMKLHQHENLQDVWNFSRFLLALDQSLAFVVNTWEKPKIFLSHTIDLWTKQTYSYQQHIRISLAVLTGFIITKSFTLKVFEHFLTEMFFKTICIKPK